jgi:hypothetical protein
MQAVLESIQETLGVSRTEIPKDIIPPTPVTLDPPRVVKVTSDPSRKRRMKYPKNKRNIYSIVYNTRFTRTRKACDMCAKTHAACDEGICDVFQLK